MATIDPADLELMINPMRQKLSPQVRAERTADAEASLGISAQEDAAAARRRKPSGPPPGAFGQTSGLEINAVGELVRPDGSIVDEEIGSQRPTALPRTETSQRRGIDRRLYGPGVEDTGTGSLFEHLRPR